MEKKRQYRSRQGRSDRQYESSMKIVGFAMLILFGGLFVLSIVELIDLLIG